MYGGFDIIDECETVEEMRECIILTKEKYSEEKNYQLYCSIFPHMNPKKSFEELFPKNNNIYKKVNEVKVDKKEQDKEELKKTFTNAMMIMKAFEKGNLEENKKPKKRAVKK